MSAYNFELPITLLLSANTTLFGEQLSLATYDYMLVNSGAGPNRAVISALSLSEIIQYHDTVSDIDPSFRINPEKFVYLKNTIDSLIREKDLAIYNLATQGAQYANFATPVKYPNAGVSPSNEPISGHYTKYLASILFGHPLARAPIRNELKIYETMYNQNLGTQFLQKLSVNNYAVTQALFEQFVANEELNNRLSVADALSYSELSVGVSYNWQNLPFLKNDTISFMVQMSGSIFVDSAVYGLGSGSAVVPFNRIFAGDANLINIGTNNDGTVVPKKWMVRLTLDE